MTDRNAHPALFITNPRQLREKFRGALVGAGVADAHGAPFERLVEQTSPR